MSRKKKKSKGMDINGLLDKVTRFISKPLTVALLTGAVVFGVHAYVQIHYNQAVLTEATVAVVQNDAAMGYQSLLIEQMEKGAIEVSDEIIAEQSAIRQKEFEKYADCQEKLADWVNGSTDYDSLCDHTKATIQVAEGKSSLNSALVADWFLSIDDPNVKKETVKSIVNGGN